MHVLIHGDCQSLSLQNFGAIITDPPYGSTQNGWDASPADFIDMALTACAEDSAIVTTCDMRYACFLLSKHMQIFSHDLVWKKTVGSGQLNINNRPLRTHENILVFKKGAGFYRRVQEKGSPYRVTRNIETEQCYGKQRAHEKVNTGTRDRKTVVDIANPRRKGGHPTQKPLDLWQWLCDSYGKGVILDPFAGSGVILDVCGFLTVGVEKDAEYYRAARASRADRIIEAELPTELRECLPNLQDTEYTVFVPKS